MYKKLEPKMTLLPFILRPGVFVTELSDKKSDSYGFNFCPDHL